MAGNLIDLFHPDLNATQLDWEKFRLTYAGGRKFIDRYLVAYSSREDSTDFANRKAMTYCPAHAKAAVNDIKNSIFQRMTDVSRQGGSSTFLNAADGSDSRGVDFNGNTMHSFIGRLILPELLTMARVGIFVDKSNSPINTRADDVKNRPYLYYYPIEDIINWRYDSNNELSAVLLRDTEYSYEQNLPADVITRYRYMWREDGVVKVKLYDEENVQIGKEITLGIKNIPFVIMELNTSLLMDAADYQIALLNLASSDMHYSLKANFPFYTEQFNPDTEWTNQMIAVSEDGTAADAEVSAPKSVNLGDTKGRRYPRGLERPAFVHPSSEPLSASMEKQKNLQIEIRQIVNLNLANVNTSQTSAESKKEDSRGLEAGLSYIGLELEYGERQIATIWAEYEGSGDVTTINYPEKYSLKTDQERIEEADKLEENASMNPSLTYKKEAAKRAAELRMGAFVSHETLKAIRAEIDKAEYIVLDDDVLHQDQEDGLVSPQTASLIRGYKVGEYKKAAKAHEERLAAIAISQSLGAGQARGISDLGDSKDGKKEKEESRDTDKDDVVKDKTRGEGE